MSNDTKWHLRASQTEAGHPTIIESTTRIVACGDSWCDGGCGLPALMLGELRAFGIMVATGRVFQPFRVAWTGTKVPVSVPEGQDVGSRIWL